VLRATFTGQAGLRDWPHIRKDSFAYCNLTKGQAAGWKGIDESAFFTGVNEGVLRRRHYTL